MIPYGKQSISESDILAVVEALKSDYLTTGPLVDDFEKQFAAFVGAKHAVAVCNATAALHLAMLVLNLKKGDRVITSPNTFLSSANAAAFVQATPDFVDIDPVSYNISPESLAENWKPDTKAVVAVDYAGQPADMPEIAKIARNSGAAVIEDACHAVGGKFEHQGQTWKIGGHPWADITTFSFHPVKTMTTGEGGMLVTDNDAYAKKARFLRSHGMTREKCEFVGLGNGKFDERGSWYYEMQELGYNYRLTDLQCALGISQLSKISEFIKSRRKIVKSYNDAFADMNLITTPALLDSSNKNLTSWHLYTLCVDFESLGKTRSEVMRELLEMGVGTQVLYIPVYLQPWYRNQYGYASGYCPNAENYYERTLSIPLSPNMTTQETDIVIDSIKRVIS